MTNYVSRGGEWNNSLAWDPHGTPGGGDTATLGSKTVTIDRRADASRTTLDEGGTLILQGGGNLHSDLNLGGVVIVESDADALIAGTLNASGDITIKANATLTIDADFASTGAVDLAAGSVLKLGENAPLLSGLVSLRSSELVFARSVRFGNTYAPLQKSLTMSDSALNVLKASGTGVVFTNYATISGAGNMGDGTMSFVNGIAGTKGTIKATGDDNALVFLLGAEESLTNANGLIEASGDAGLTVKVADAARGGGKLTNGSVMRAVNGSRIEISQVAVVNQGPSTADLAVMEATDIATLAFDEVSAKNTNGQILATGGGTIKLTSTDISGGSVTLDGARTALVTTGSNLLEDVDFNSTGALLVQSGSVLEVRGAGSSSIAAATIDGRLTVGHDLTLEENGQVTVTGELGSSSTLTNVDEKIGGTGVITAANLVNGKNGSISGSLAIEVSSSVAGSGKLTNAGTIAGGTIKAADVDNEGTITGATFDVAYTGVDDHAISNDVTGVINSATFGRTLIVNDGLIEANGAGLVTTFAGTKLHGGTLSSSNGGEISVEAATDVTLLDPTTIAAGTTIALTDGASVDLDGVAVLDDVKFSLHGDTQTTTLNLVGASLTLQEGTAVTLTDSDSNLLLISSLTNAGGTISGAGEITESAPGVSSVLSNGAGGLIEAKGANGLMIDIDRLVNDGVLEADNATLTLLVDSAITGGGEARVTNGGTIDMSDVRQYFGSFRYVGQGTILGPDLVPAGTITGFATGDTYVFGQTNVQPDQFTTLWTANAARTGGTLTVLTDTGEAYANLSLAGRYDSDDFAVSEISLEDGNHLAVSFVGALEWKRADDGYWQSPSRWTPTGLLVPGASDDVLITAVKANDPTKTYTVKATKDTTVNSLATGAVATLEIRNSKLTTTTGTRDTLNSGTVQVVNGATFAIGGTFAQSATGLVRASGAQGAIEIVEGGTISGGTLLVRGGATLRVAGGGTATLKDMEVQNRSAIDISGQTRLVLDGTYAFGNAGVIKVGEDATLALSNSRISGNTVALDGALAIGTNTNLRATVAITGSGYIVSDGKAAVLTNMATISGGGKIGDATLTFINKGMLTAAAGERLDIATGGNTTVNYGTMTSSIGATLGFTSDLRNVGSLLASGGAVQFEAFVDNRATMQVDGRGSVIDYGSTFVNSGAVSATRGGTIHLRDSVAQRVGGELQASDQGSRIVLDAGSSVAGGRIAIGYLAALEASSGGKVALTRTDVLLEESSDIKVTNATLTIANSTISADRTAEISATGSKAILALSDSSVTGGVIDVNQTSLLIGGNVTLTETQTRLDKGSILDNGQAGVLTNAGSISVTRASGIDGDALSLVNQGTITTAPSAVASLAIDTGANAVLNSGTISASLAGSKVTVAGQIINEATGHLLSSAGALTLATLKNLGDLKAAAGTIDVTGSVSNEGGQIQAAAGGKVTIDGAVTNDAGGVIRATGTKSLVDMAASLKNSGTIEAKAGGTVDVLVDVNDGQLSSTGIDSLLSASFTASGSGNRGSIVADNDGKVTIEGGLANSGGARLEAYDGGEIEVHGAVTGGIAWLSGDDSVLDLQGSATEDTTTQVSFLDDGISQLVLDHSSRFSGTVAGLGTGDTIDVTDIGFVAGSSRYDQANHQLFVSDGTHTATIQLLGTYMASQFAFSSDGSGGTLITTQALAEPATQQNMLAAAHA